MLVSEIILPAIKSRMDILNGICRWECLMDVSIYYIYTYGVLDGTRRKAFIDDGSDD